ncbi:MAG: hypothetical protein MI919_33820, partial [Holophagales bacterium]|nr:hypothetical protein [Holophagales bacterium]
MRTSTPSVLTTARPTHRRCLVPRAAMAGFLTLLLTAGAGAQGTGEVGQREGGDTVFTDSIEVRMFNLQVHVWDRDAQTVRGLGPDDFVVRIDGRVAEVEAADWVEPSLVEAGVLALPAGTDTRSPPPTPPAAGNRQQPLAMVIFVQNDFEPSRLRGFLRTFPKVEMLLRRLPPEDRIALVSFDHHLKLRADFTTDRDRIVGLFPEAMRRGTPPPLAPADPGEAAPHAGTGHSGRGGSPPSLDAHWSYDEAR